MNERDALPRHTTPTWEMELLISGATVFALLQLPGVLDELFYAWFPRFARPMAEMVMIPYLYGKVAVYALIVTFVAHLALRAYWVGLVGLQSVHGEGILWERLRSGPLYRRVLRTRIPPATVLIERADNRASLVFGYGVAFALLTMTPLLLLAFAAAMTCAFQFATGSHFAWQGTWTAALALTVLPLALAAVIDRLFGKWLSPDGIAARTLSRVMRAYLALGISSVSSYPMLVFISRMGQKRGGLVIALALASLVGLAMLQLMVREGEVDLGSYGALALGEPGAVRALRNEHYAEYRHGADLSSTAPFIPAEVVRGDWLKLFVPFQPRRDSVGLEQECAPADAAGIDAALPGEERERLATDAARIRVLDCLARLYAPTLDGEPLTVSFDAADDPGSGLRGMVAMLPVKGLAAGRHELTVRRLRAPTADADAPAPAPHRIVFWR
jgi:hypothetical protein